MLTILEGDCREALRSVPDGTVQCCVTSPPYFGLRDYGTARWEGGDPSCDHKRPTSQGTTGQRADRTFTATPPYREKCEKCEKCGAHRIDKQIGLEKSPEEFIANLVDVFRAVRRVLKDDGTLWLNLGDSYCSTGGAGGTMSASAEVGGDKRQVARPEASNPEASNPEAFGRWNRNWGNAKPKDLLMIPARVAMALQADGWHLRSMIPWLKRNAMPESVNDRPTTATEYIFLLSKSARYFYDKSEVMIPASPNSHARLAQDVENQIGTDRANGGAKTNGNFKAVCGEFPHGSIQARKARANPDTKSFPADGRNGIRPNKNELSDDRRKSGFNARWDETERKLAEVGSGVKNNSSMDDALAVRVLARNRRNSDWFMESWQGLMGDEDGDPIAFVVNPQPYSEAHFATWPEKLVRPMVLAGSRPGDVILDPFFGSGCTGKVALELGRTVIGCELNPEYIKLARQRCETTIGLGI